MYTQTSYTWQYNSAFFLLVILSQTMCHVHSNTHPKVTPAILGNKAEAILCNRNENPLDFYLGNKYHAPFQTKISDWDLQRKNLLGEKMVWM